MPLFEFGKPEVQLDAAQFGIKRECSPVSLGGFDVLFLLRQINPEAGEGAGVFGVLSRDSPPRLSGVREFTLLIESEGFGSRPGLTIADMSWRSCG